jgi:hypothetical protein
MKRIASHIKSFQNLENREIALFLVPRKTLICERVLEEEGVFGDVQISEFPLDLFPLEDDFFSLELNTCFKDLYVNKDTSCLYSIAKAIMKLQKKSGIIPKILGKGEYARKLCDYMTRKDLLQDLQELNSYSVDLDSVRKRARSLNTTVYSVDVRRAIG